MTLKTICVALALLAAGTAWAQGPAPAAPSAPASPASPAKKALVARVLELQRPGIEALARNLAQQPAAQLMQQAGPALQNVPADKREVVAREIEADVRKYVDEAVPIVRDRAVKLAPSTMGTTMEERLDEDELRQVVATLESPAFRKFQTLFGEMERAFAQKVATEVRPAIEPKAKALRESMAKRLGVSPSASAPSASGAKK